jgi:hypothetical protein
MSNHKAALVTLVTSKLLTELIPLLTPDEENGVNNCQKRWQFTFTVIPFFVSDVVIPIRRDVINRLN